MATVEEMRAVVQKKVEPELAFIWDDLEIEIKYQHALALKRITTLSRFGEIADENLKARSTELGPI